jgi:hypothetical protein
MADTPPKRRLGRVRRALVAVAARLGWTEGQVQTVAIGLVVAAVAITIGIPPVLNHQGLVAEGLTSPVENPKSELTPSTPPAGAAPLAVSGATPAAGAHVSPRRDRSAQTDADGVAVRRARDAAAPAATAAHAEPGANGKCGVTVRSIDNPRHPAGTAPMAVWIYEPTGAADASVTGGRCDDGRRPAIFMAHGFGQTDPASYQALINHFVSVGNIVVYPAYAVNDGSRSTLEESYRVVDAGFVVAVERTPRIDTTRAGWWGHSHGGGMIPYLVQQGGARNWGKRGLWMSVISQAFTELVGAADIPVPANTEEMTVAFQHDALADNRLGNDVFKSLQLPASQKRHATVLSGTHGAQPFAAEHGAPEGGNGLSVDAVDALLWRYADLLEVCSLFKQNCTADLTTLPGPNGPEKHAIVSQDPVDVGPYPAVLAECDAAFGPTLNPRIARCGETRVM